MAENLDIHARLTASNEMSPTIRRVIADFKQLESLAKRVSVQLSGLGRAGISSADGFSRAAQAASQQMRGLATTGKSAARSVSEDWRKAADQRITDARRMFSQLERMEASYLRQVERRAVAERKAERSAGRGGAGRLGYGGIARVPGPTPRQVAIGGAVAAGGIGAAFKRRMVTEMSETKALIFGDLTREDVKSERRNWIDKFSIKFGESTSKIIDSYTESLKAGFGKDAARKITQGALEAMSALELDVGELIKLGGKVATIFGGDVKNVNPKRVLGLMNAIAVAAAETAADPNEVIAGFKKGSSALSMSKLSERDLATLLSVAISSGVQPGKAGNAISHLVSTLVGGGSARGQKAKDLDQAAKILGFGGRASMSKRAADDPMGLIIELFKRLKSLSDQRRTLVARLLGGDSWDDEILQIGNAVDQIIDVRKAVEQKTSTIAEASKLKTNSLQGRWSSIIQGFALGFEKIGDGFTDAFEEMSDWYRNFSDAFDYNRLTENVRNFVAGIRTGFGYASWRELLDDAFGGASAGDAKKYGEIGKGIAEGLKVVGTTMRDALSWVAQLAGVKVGDTKAMAKFATELLGFTIVLRFLAPLVTVLGAVTAFLWKIGKWVEWIVGLLPGKEALKRVAPKAAGRMAPLAGWLGMLLYGDGRPDNSPEDLTGLQEEFKKERKKRLEKEQGKDASPTEFSGRRRTSSIDELNDQLAKYRAVVERSSFISGSSGVSSGSVKAAFGNGRPAGFGRGSPTALFNSTPGSILPDFGVGSGGIIRRDQIPSFAGTGGSMAGGLSRSAFERVFAGTPMDGKYDQVVAAAKANGISPALLAGIVAHETGRGKNLNWNNPGGLMTSTGKMRFGSLDAGIDKTASVVAKNWTRAGDDLNRMGQIYAPVGAANDPDGLNRHWVGSVSKYMSQMADSQATPSGLGDPVKTAERFVGKNEWRDTREIANFIGHDPRGNVNAWCARFVNAALRENGMRGTGSAAARSFYRWGSAVEGAAKRGDIMVAPHHVGMATGRVREDGAIEMISGNHGDSVGLSWERPGKYQLRRGAPPIQNVPAPADATRNVPAQSIPDASLGLGRGTPGNVAIHINGGAHDQEALATLVQRRIDESMNWRAHDSETEYT